jgi:hypothetical protein
MERKEKDTSPKIEVMERREEGRGQQPRKGKSKVRKNL